MSRPHPPSARPRRAATASLVGAVLLCVVASGCASRRPRDATIATTPVPRAVDASCDSRADIEAAFDRSKRGTPSIPMLSEEQAHAAMPSLFKRRAMPYLLRVGGLQPKTSESLMAFAKTMRTEGDLDAELLDDVFWVVSHANQCLY